MSKRYDPNRNKVKTDLLIRYGNYCWLCEKHFKRQNLTLHHVVEWRYTHHTVEKESCIVCEHCHFDVINKVEYESDEYNSLMNQVEEYRITH